MPLFDVEPNLLAAIEEEKEARRRAFVPYQRTKRDPRPALFDEPNGYERLDTLKAKAVLLTLRKNGLDICRGSHLTHNDDNSMELYGVLPLDRLRGQYQSFDREIWHDDLGSYRTNLWIARIVLLCEQHFPEDPTAVDSTRYIKDGATFTAVVEKDGRLVTEPYGKDVSEVPILRRIYKPVFRAMGLDTPIRDLYATTHADPETVIQLSRAQF